MNVTMSTPDDDNIDNLLAFYHKEARKTPYGKIFLTISRDQDLERSAHASYIKSIGKYKDNMDAKLAIAKIIDEIEAEKRSGGAIAIVIHPMNGIASQITVQPSERKSFSY